MERFKKDLVRKELVPVKVLMFLIYGGQATLYPYFTVHLKSLGVSITQTAIIFAVQPIIALLVAPAIGIIADKIGNFKFIFCFFLTFAAVTANLLLLVPPLPKTEELIYFNAKCDLNAELTIQIDKDFSCNVQSMVNPTLNMNGRFECDRPCENDNGIFFPLYIREAGQHCSMCGSGKELSCMHINESTLLNVSVNIQDNNSSFMELITEKSYIIQYKNTSYNELQCSCTACNASCNFVIDTPIASCESPILPEKYGVTFWSYFVIRLIVTLGIGLVNGLFDAASMTIIQDLKADVGFQRFWSTFGMCLLAPISGLLADKIGTYTPCFLMYGALYLLATITSLRLDLSMKLPSDSALSNFAKLLKNPEVLVLLLQIAVLGICWGFLENFLFLFLEDELGANKLIMGLTVTVGSGTGLFMALTATWCTRKLGYVKVIILAFAAYTVRFIGYAYAKNAYICLIFEMMENFTVTLLTVGVTLYCTELASLESLTSIMTLWNGLHIISGRAFGSLLGGFIVRTIGFRETFKVFAYISCSFGVLYALVYVLWLRKRQATHRKTTVDSGRSCSLSEEKEEKTLKEEAFSSLSMHCSFDSPTIMHFIPDSPGLEFRRRTQSYTPEAYTNSFRLEASKPRYSVSFTEGKTHKPSLFIVTENTEDLEGHSNRPTTVEELRTGRKGYVTKF